MKSKLFFLLLVIMLLFSGFRYNIRQTTAVSTMDFSAACGDQSGAALGNKLFLPFVFRASSGLSPAGATNQVAGEPRLQPVGQVVAPPLDDSVATDFFTATAFLYSGDDPIQTGVQPGTIDPRRVAVLRGRVTTREGTPLPDVRIRIFDHGEYGETLTREDGMFDIAVNSGGQLTVCFEKTGYLPVHRQVQTPWRDYI